MPLTVIAPADCRRPAVTVAKKLCDTVTDGITCHMIDSYTPTPMPLSVIDWLIASWASSFASA